MSTPQHLRPGSASKRDRLATSGRGIAAALLALAVSWGPSPAMAQARPPASPPGGSAATPECPVTAAADAALQRQFDLLDALKVDPAQFFHGENSCIDPSLLRSFDISSAIPDPIGLLQRIAESLGPNLLDAAKRKVCGVLNDQLGQAVSGMRSVMNKAGGEDLGIQAALDRVTNRAGLDRIKLDGLGQYQPAPGGSLPELDLPAPPVIPRIQTPPQIQAPAPIGPAAPAPAGTSSGAGPTEYQRRLRCSYLGEC